MKNTFKVLFIAVFFSLSSCEFGDTNVNPSTPVDVSMSALLPSAETALSWAIGGEMVRMSGILTQQFKGINAQQADNTRYLVQPANTDGMWQRLYFNSLSSCNQVIEKAEAENAPHYGGVAKILMATGMLVLTDAFGDVPYSEAFQGDEGNFTPVYDTQEQLYTNTIPALLDEAISLLSEETSVGGSPGREDFIYGGNLASWITAARSLKARLTLQAAKKGASAYDDALVLLAEGVLSSNDQDFEMIFGSGDTEVSPQYQFGQSRSGNLRIAPHFENFIRDDDTRKGRFIGIKESSYDHDKNFVFSGYYTSKNSPAVLMSYVEVKFIESESQLMKGASDETAAKAALDAAVAASFSKITGETTPASYATALDAKWAAAATQQDKLKVIIDEKYVACYSQGLLAWTDYRRTNYPSLVKIPNGSNASNANGEIPRRLPYPEEEQLLNPNIPTIIPNLQDRFWWDE